jgi:hypothetical protein
MTYLGRLILCVRDADEHGDGVDNEDSHVVLTMQHMD